MNLYTLPENQKLIWDTISKVPNFQQMRQNNPQKSEQWFREIIQLYYNKHSQSVVDKSSLSFLNKETIRYMLQTLKQDIQQNDPLSYQTPSISGSSFQNNFSSLETNSNETRNFILEQKKTKMNNDFNMRQQEYSNLFEKPKIEEIDFREKSEEDKPIDNMDELIKRQMAERAYDIQNINPPEKINEQPDGVDVEKEKRVSFEEAESKQINDDKIEKLNRKIDDFIEEINGKIKEIQNDIIEIKKEQKKSTENVGINNAEKIISKLRTLEKPQEKETILSETIN